MTDKEIKQRESLMAQLLVLQTRVIYQQTVITTGIYKTREVYRGLQCTPENRLTEEELRNDEIAIMKRHINNMQDIQDALTPSENEV